MLYLNLLSEQKKEELQKKILLEFTTTILELLFSITVLAAIILLVSKIILQNSFNEAIAQSTLITTSYGAINQEIRGLNTQIEQIDRLERERLLAADFLTHMAELTPKEVTIKSLSLNAQDKNVLLSGKAATRDSLLLFIKNLEGGGLYTRVESPISNIFERTNINFTLSAVLNKNKITELHSH